MFKQWLECLQHLNLAGHAWLAGGLALHNGHAQWPLVAGHQALQVLQQQAGVVSFSLNIFYFRIDCGKSERHKSWANKRSYVGNINRKIQHLFWTASKKVVPFKTERHAFKCSFATKKILYVFKRQCHDKNTYSTYQNVTW